MEDSIKTEDDLLSLVVNYFEDFEDQYRTARKLSEQDRDYVDHKQWTREEEDILRQRKQPKTVNNRIRKKINTLRGLERQARTDPRAFPRTPVHEKDAEAVTDALRFVADNAQFNRTRSRFYENFIVEGTGGCEVIVNKDKEIELPHIQWDRLFWDYHSRNNDFSDARFTGIIIWSDKDEALQQFPDAHNIIMSSFSSLDDTFEDKPISWTDTTRNRVRIAQIYFRHNAVWHLAFFTKAGFLVPPTPSPWVDDKGRPENGMILQSAYVDREGNRFGEPRFMIEQQDSINKRESKMLHLVSQRQTFGNKRSGLDARVLKSELAKPDGHLEFKSGKMGEDFGILPTGDMASGQFNLLQEAKAEMDQTSVSASLTGSDPRELSGRAILAQQAGGQSEISPLNDGRREWDLRVYRSIWNRIRQFWTEERWIRVTDSENNVKFVGLNRPVSVEEAVEQEGGVLGGFENDPRLQMISKIENQVSEIDVDIILEESPDTVNIQQEQFELIARLAEAYGPQAVPFEEVVRLSQLRGKQEFLTRLTGDEQQQAKREQERAQTLDLQKEGVKAKIEKDRAAAMLDIAKADEIKDDAGLTGDTNMPPM